MIGRLVDRLLMWAFGPADPIDFDAIERLCDRAERQAAGEERRKSARSAVA